MILSSWRICSILPREQAPQATPAIRAASMQVGRETRALPGPPEELQERAEQAESAEAALEDLPQAPEAALAVPGADYQSFQLRATAAFGRAERQLRALPAERPVRVPQESRLAGLVPQAARELASVPEQFGEWERGLHLVPESNGVAGCHSLPARKPARVESAPVPRSLRANPAESPDCRRSCPCIRGFRIVGKVSASDR